MMPGNAIKRHPFVEERTEKLRKLYDLRVVLIDFSKGYLAI